MNEQVHLDLLQTMNLTLLRQVQNLQDSAMLTQCPTDDHTLLTDSLLQELTERIQTTVKVEYREHVVFSGGKT